MVEIKRKTLFVGAFLTLLVVPFSNCGQSFQIPHLDASPGSPLSEASRVFSPTVPEEDLVENSGTSNLSFAFLNSFSAAECASLTATSQNHHLLPDASITFIYGDQGCLAQVTLQPNQYGSATLSIQSSTDASIDQTVVLSVNRRPLTPVETTQIGLEQRISPQQLSIGSSHRNHIFYVGDTVQFGLSNGLAQRYEVKDYYGTLVDQGEVSGSTLTSKVSAPGWYKINVYGAADQGEPWRYDLAGTHFVIFRDDPHFPKPPPAGTPNPDYEEDEYVRGVVAMGPQRHKADIHDVPGTIARLKQAVAIDKEYYVGRDPIRPRPLLIVFPDGFGNTKDTPEHPADYLPDPDAYAAVIRPIATAFKDDVKYWEGRNEPNYNYTGWWSKTEDTDEYHTLQNTLKSVDPSLKLLGPGIVSLAPQADLEFYNDYYLKYMLQGKGPFDAFSFHAYNNLNGSIWHGRQAFRDLNSLPAAALGPIAPIEKWQTEQGSYVGPADGIYAPRLTGRETMLRFMIYEQNGIPKEHNHFWYDTSHGFWEQPAWWENEDSSLNSSVALIRVWSEEVFGTQFTKAYYFGTNGENLYLGSLFSGPGKTIAAFMTGGNTKGSITLQVQGASVLHITSPFGIEANLAVKADGIVELPVTELPTYVDLSSGATIDVVPLTYRENLAQKEGSAITERDSNFVAVNDQTISLLNDGSLEDYYYRESTSYLWRSIATFPLYLDISFAQIESVSKVNIFATPVSQQWGTLMDYELQYLDPSTQKWVPIEHVMEPAKTLRQYTRTNRSKVDSYFSDRSVFEHRFTAVNTQQIRIKVNKVSLGAAATDDAYAAGGYWKPGFRQATLREIEVFP